MKTRYEKLRLPVSRLASAAAVLLLLFSSNRWETGHEAVATGLFALGMFLIAIGSLGRIDNRDRRLDRADERADQAQCAEQGNRTFMS